MHTPAQAPSRTKQVVFFGILATAIALVSLLTVYKLSVTNAYRIFAVQTETLSIPTDAAAIARGTHLVQDVMACQSCHGEDLSGRVLVDDAQGVITAPNLTSAERTDADWVRTLRLGTDGEGRGLWIMPARAHSALTDADLTAIVASVRALGPRPHALPQSHLRLYGNWRVATRQLQLVQKRAVRIQTPFEALQPAPNAVYGTYLSALMQCATCHAAPGTAAPGRSEAVVIAQETLHDKARFAQRLRGAHVPAADKLQSTPMPPAGYARLTNVEVEALWRYFQGP